MNNGPIEFLSDRAAHGVPVSEYGGADGLIQPRPHEPSASEAVAASRRGEPVDVLGERIEGNW